MEFSFDADQELLRETTRRFLEERHSLEALRKNLETDFGHVSPEAAVKGPIGLLKDGDIIDIDVPKRKLNVKINDDELEKRAKYWIAKEPKIKTGYLLRYSKMVQPADKGSILIRD